MSDPSAVCYEQRILQMRPRIFKWVVSRVGNETLAEDLTQETLIRAWERSHQHTPTRQFDSWVISIALNLVIDYSRLRKNRPHLSLCTLLLPEREYELADSANDPAKLLLEETLDEGLEWIVSKLGKRDRRLLSLLADGLTYPEIAQLWPCGETAVRSRVSRLRRRVQALNGLNAD